MEEPTAEKTLVVKSGPAQIIQSCGCQNRVSLSEAHCSGGHAAAGVGRDNRCGERYPLTVNRGVGQELMPVLVLTRFLAKTEKPPDCRPADWIAAFFIIFGIRFFISF